MFRALMVRREGLIFLLLTALVFAYLVARAYSIPLVHDEARTFFMYVWSGDFLPFRAKMDAGNHVLVTATAYVSQLIFGPSELSLRLSNVLSYPVYALGVWGLIIQVRDRLVRWVGYLAFLLLPFLLEFFALFRGYGMGIGFFMVALWQGGRFVQHRQTGALIWTLLPLAVATYASFTLLLLWTSALGLLVLVIIFLRHSMRSMFTQLGVLVVLGIGPWAYAVSYSMALSEYGAFYYGSQAGLLFGTVASLAEMILGTSHLSVMLLVVLVCMLLIWHLAQVLRNWRSIEPRAIVFLMTSILLVSEVLGKAMLTWVFDIPYPEDRTALSWVVLFLVAFLFMVDVAAEKRPALRLAVLPLLALPLITLGGINTTHTSFWPEQSVPDSFLDRVDDLQQRSDRPLVVGMYRLLESGWAFSQLDRGAGRNVAVWSEFPNGPHDVRICDSRFLAECLPGFTLIDEAPANDLHLLVREPLSDPKVVGTNTIEGPTEVVDEYFTLSQPVVDSIRGKQFQVEIRVDITIPQPRTVVNLVVEVSNGSGHVFYDLVALNELRHTWNGETLHTTRCIPTIGDDVEKCVIYFWKELGDRYSMKHLEVKLIDIP